MSQPISDVKIDLIVDTSPIKAIQVGEVTNQPVAFDIGEVPNLISNGLPAAGSTGQQLAKKSNNDYDTQWVTPHEIIAGGAAGQVLGKKSATDYDTQWTNLPSMPIYDECDSLTPPWYQFIGAGVPSVQTVADSSVGGKVIRCVGNVGQLVRLPLVPFDPNALYRIKFRVRQTVDAANSNFYGGVEGVAADGVTIVAADGSTARNQPQWAAANAVALTVAGGWQEFTGYIKGVAAAGTGGSCPSPLAPGRVHQNVRYIRPILYTNHSGGTGTTEIDYVSLEIVPEPEQPLPIYDEGGSLTPWTQWGGTGTVSVAQVADSSAGGKVLAIANGGMNLARMPLVPYDPNALYRIKYRVRRTVNPGTGTTSIYAGFEGVAADGITVVMPDGTSTRTGGAGHSMAVNGTSLLVAGGWQEFTGYAKGVAATGTNAATTITTPGQMHQNTRYIRPIVTINSGDAAGKSEIDYVSLEIVNPIAIANSTEVTLSGDGAGTPLSAALTGTVSGKDLNVPAGNVIAGGTGVTTQYVVASRLRVAPDEWESRLYTSTTGDATIDVLKNGTMVNRFTILVDGTITARSGGQTRPIPFATWVGRFSVVLSSATFGTAALTLPTGRFTAATTDVGVYATSINQVYSAYISSFTLTSFTVGVRHLDNTAASATINVAGLAVQQTPSGLGRAAERLGDPNLTTVLATCHTGGCDNVDVVVPVEIVDENTSIGCGVCFQPITDVTTP